LGLPGGTDNRQIDVLSKAILACHSITERDTTECNISIVASTSSWAVTNARRVMNKLAKLHLFLKTHALDLLCVTETWLNANTPDSLIAPKSYNVYRYSNHLAFIVKKRICLHIV